MLTASFLAVILCAQLGSPVFTVRQRAEAQLREMKHIEPILALHAESRDPEVRQRIKRLQHANTLATVDAMLIRNAPVPFIDLVHDCWPDKWFEYVDMAAIPKEAAGFVFGWPEYRYATKLYVTDLACQGVPVADLEALVVTMKQRGENWDGRTTKPACKSAIPDWIITIAADRKRREEAIFSEVQDAWKPGQLWRKPR